jgi:GTP cyclohydrolase II
LIKVYIFLTVSQVGSIKLMTNNPRKISELAALGVVVSGRLSAEVP